MGKKQFRIADIAELLDVKKSILRVWEEGFNVPAYRTDGAGRLYSLQDVEIFSLIKKQLQHHKASVEDVKKMLEEKFGGGLVEKTQAVSPEPQIQPQAPMQEICEEESVCPAQICKQATGEECTEESIAIEFNIHTQDQKQETDTPALVVDSIAYAQPAIQEAVQEVVQETIQEMLQEPVQEPMLELSQEPVQISCHCKEISKELEEFKRHLIAFKEQLAR
jgi:DNA-binding transcriptional MerR regulator